MKPKALIVMYPNAAEDVYGGELAERIAERVDLLGPSMNAESFVAMPELVSEVEVLFSGWGAPRMDEPFLDVARKLKAVFYSAGTIRCWATEGLWKRQILVCNAAAANAVPVADYTVGAVFLSLKRAWHYMAQARTQGRSPKQAACPGAYGSKVGLISLGLVARQVAQRLRSSDLEILAYDPFVSETDATSLGVRLVSLEELFGVCDVVSLHAPLLPQTQGLLGAGHFSAMKQGATFINTARGEIVRENELIDVLSKRQDLTAVLDVTFPEPPLPGSPLFSLPNVVLTPHIAGSLGRECLRLGQAMLDDYDRWRRGEKPVGQVTWEKARLMA